MSAEDRVSDREVEAIGERGRDQSCLSVLGWQCEALRASGECHGFGSWNCNCHW